MRIHPKIIIKDNNVKLVNHLLYASKKQNKLPFECYQILESNNFYAEIGKAQKNSDILTIPLRRFVNGVFVPVKNYMLVMGCEYCQIICLA